MNAEKRHHSQIRITINDESQGSIAKKLRCDEKLYHIFIIHSGWWRGTVVERRSLAGELSLSCARPAADG